MRLMSTETETLIGSDTLATMASSGLADEIILRRDEYGFSVHVRAGKVHAVLRTKRGLPKICQSMEPLATQLAKLGVRTFTYEDTTLDLRNAPHQEGLFSAPPSQREARTRNEPMRKSA